MLSAPSPPSLPGRVEEKHAGDENASGLTSVYENGVKRSGCHEPGKPAIGESTAEEGKAP